MKEKISAMEKKRSKMKKRINAMENWTAITCLNSALEAVKDGDELIIMAMRGGKNPQYWTANLRVINGIFMAECIKHKLMEDVKEGA
jgi:hypothetical protein